MKKKVWRSLAMHVVHAQELWFSERAYKAVRDDQNTAAHTSCVYILQLVVEANRVKMPEKCKFSFCAPPQASIDLEQRKTQHKTLPFHGATSGILGILELIWPESSFAMEHLASFPRKRPFIASNMSSFRL
jgi:hypothetical protein